MIIDLRSWKRRKPALDVGVFVSVEESWFCPGIIGTSVFLPRAFSLTTSSLWEYKGDILLPGDRQIRSHKPYRIPIASQPSIPSGVHSLAVCRHHQHRPVRDPNYHNFNANNRPHSCPQGSAASISIPFDDAFRVVLRIQSGAATNDTRNNPFLCRVVPRKIIKVIGV